MKKKIIYREDNHQPYLIRYCILKLSFLRIVLHKILQSDNDCLHDHPWNFISIILKGGYWEGTSPEQILNEKECDHYKKICGNNCIYYKWYGKFRILFRRAEWKHRLKLKTITKQNFNGTIINKQEIPCTTLVIMFKRRREWGFFTKAGWLHWSKYQSKQNCE